MLIITKKEEEDLPWAPSSGCRDPPYLWMPQLGEGTHGQCSSRWGCPGSPSGGSRDPPYLWMPQPGEGTNGLCSSRWGCPGFPSGGNRDPPPFAGSTRSSASQLLINHTIYQKRFLKKITNFSQIWSSHVDPDPVVSGNFCGGIRNQNNFLGIRHQLRTFYIKIWIV